VRLFILNCYTDSKRGAQDQQDQIFSVMIYNKLQGAKSSKCSLSSSIQQAREAKDTTQNIASHTSIISMHFSYALLFTQTHKEKHHINKIKIFNIMIQNKLQGAKAQKQGKQETPHRTPLVTHILDRPIRSRAEAPASNTSQHAQHFSYIRPACIMH
jgi:hypothetical protein